MADQLRDQLQSTLGSAYLIEGELGGGGMSRVFVARETALDRLVVIKVLPSSLAEGMSVERFKREIGFAARLQHPHIVPVHTAGETGGLPYYTMPFVDGESLRARLKGGPLSVPKVISVLRDVAKALAYAHENGVIHRDIKPDNVLLSGGAAAVTDFGVGKAVSAATTSAEMLTRGGVALGTPEYMAPEQAAADPSADHRVDIYAFGVMAYEMIAGNPPFHGRTPQQLLAAQMVERPRPIENVSSGVPPLLAQMVMKCLEKAPDQRPQSAKDLLIDLDRISNGDGDAAVPAILRNARRNLATALTLYVAALISVAILTKSVMIAAGLPDWVFPGALIVMALGLPVILVTAFGRRATPWLSWRRTAIGGVAALAGFAVLVAAFMIMRASGIGPVGSLIAAGKLSEKDRLLVTDFRGGGADSSLSGIVAEAMRMDLGQSSVVSVVPPSSIADALGRMRRDRTSRVDLALAREIAAREGIKGIVDGSVTPLAGGYVVTVRLLAAATGDDLASFRETIDGPKELIPTLDKLSGQLREKIGESLKTVRANPPLEQVTTSSLEALRKYAAGMRAFDVEGDLPKSVELFREAVAIDTTFAAAYRKLGVALGNLGMPRPSVDSALRRAYDYRDRLTDVERYLTIGSYFTGGTQKDRKRSADAYEAVLEIDSLNYVALNNLGNVLVTRREFARAEALYRRAIAAGTARATIYTNLVDAQLSQRKFAAAESTAALGLSRFASNAGLRFMDISMLIARKQLDSLEKRAVELRATDPYPGLRSGATWFLRGVALMRGRIDEAARLTDEANAMDAARGIPTDPHARALDSAWMDIWHREQHARGAQTLDVTLARIPFRSLPLVDRRYFDVAMLYAMGGRPDRARAVIAERNAEVKDTALLRQEIPTSHVALAEIALAEKRPLDALAEFRLGDRLPDGPVNACVRCSLADVARAHDAAGARDSAIATMERYLALPSTTVWPDQNYLAPFHRRLGELYEARGDLSKAILHYERFVELWKNADRELQPKVAKVQQLLSVLRKASR